MQALLTVLAHCYATIFNINCKFGSRTILAIVNLHIPMVSPTRFGSIKSIVLGEMLFEKKIQQDGCLWFHLRYQNGMILDLPSHIALDSQVSSPLCI